MTTRGFRDAVGAIASAGLLLVVSCVVAQPGSARANAPGETSSTNTSPGNSSPGAITNPAAAVARARLAARLHGKPPTEQLDYLRTLQRGGRDDEALSFHMGNVFYALGKNDSAVAYFRHATDLDPKNSKTWVNLGLVYDAMHQRGAARQAFHRAIEINPRDVLAHCHLGSTYYDSGDVNKAVTLWLEALQIDPRSAQARYDLGTAFADEKIFGEAVTEWKKVIELDPNGDLGKSARENVKLIETYLDLEK